LFASYNGRDERSLEKKKEIDDKGERLWMFIFIQNTKSSSLGGIQKLN